MDEDSIELGLNGTINDSHIRATVSRGCGFDDLEEDVLFDNRS